ncbi:MAG: class I SAM-dependent methyltransferase [Anaerolineaceae bacterium]|nr:class I SAM-dependent methyltransferase [Anaerolineaceae bacterium]
MYAHRFSKQAEKYARYRPLYPPELYAALAGVAPGRELAVDCATGNGQAALGLAQHFRRVAASDANLRQLGLAMPGDGVSYCAAQVEQLPLAGHSADLVSAAMAFHWFEFEPFFAEARRVLRPGGVLAVWGYDRAEVEPGIEAVLDHYEYVVTEPYRPKRVKLLADGYRSAPFPLQEIPLPQFYMQADWRMDELIGYLESWSMTQLLIDEQGPAPLHTLRRELARAWGDPNLPRRIRWPLGLRAGRFAA